MKCHTDNLGQQYLLFVHDGLNYLELGNFEAAFGKTIRDGNFQGKIDILFIHPGDSWERYHLYHQDEPIHQKFLTFFHQEFFPFFNSESQGIHKIGMLGDSLAATASVSLASHCPQRFTHLLLQSAAYRPVEFLEGLNREQVHHWKVYQVVGLKEDHFESPLTGQKLDILTENRKLYNKLKQMEVRTDYYEEDEEHRWEFWRNDLVRALSYFFEK